ncbi:arginine beta-hydroxylase, Fe(II)/alpha-ketoglutarate-dependent [Bacillus toyonensis]|uniref:Arginine beta-hydroxylase, Fe(II)/alpha-ketoglutarate-dependent n=1 Tax=Bacillus toyonensis TaxID=155322 RepID=A0AAP8EYG0_9BACI|nr:guanitoxin biosynthesis L-enduracididine beta-hydroxylase GntD [Bacillus toyonensis]MED3481496.1 guanitoxin biosynthesis L-enduracididine beta-hydroxylase GntD [Bacillus toyonensis]PEB89656.1 arginine beta-hydroxylase, Fe(II)/alpha-ketoglutarate-dependent [Bacillus toyonensis]PEE27745.1 arginine beta-hydroxylase, Fe(II)/alpha-ketoglutarate-dependent [Bacillus toyonensis]PEF79774.1 arginine beta-hydroxylase, Fe(II)/alpha-ketoglutarate-dependent [Bacillus toyonensis]PEL00908.1 arginine beta-h
MHSIELTSEEIKSIMKIVNDLSSKYPSVEDEDFLLEASIYAQELPRRLRSEVNRFRLLETGKGIFLIKGFPINDIELGQTPSHWENKPDKSPTIQQDIYFYLCSCLLADPIAWATQQEGYVMHDILPVKGYELEQLGAGSEVLLTWHTEDAFHPYRTDYLGLMCLRNPDNVETTYASIDNLELDEATKEKLFERKYVIRPDESHLEKNRGEIRKEIPVSEEVLRRSYDRINKLNTSPEKVSILFGDPKNPYLRLDPYFMDDVLDDIEANNAFNEIVKQVDEKIAGYSIQPGEIIFLDNYKVVHGRNPFKARFDGTDRWLKRLNITRDIRKSRDFRISPENRVIF